MTGVMCWQTATGWAFWCADKTIRKHIMRMCKQQLGRGHGGISMWHAGHDWYKGLDEYRLVPVIFVRDPDMILQLRLAYS
jgi:hypothetical protein